MNGEIIKLFIDKGFGFIRGEDKISRFFHVDEVTPRVTFDLMHEGQRVSFIPVDMGEQNPAMAKGNGLRASQVTPLED